MLCNNHKLKISICLLHQSGRRILSLRKILNTPKPVWKTQFPESSWVFETRCSLVNDPSLQIVRLRDGQGRVGKMVYNLSRRNTAINPFVNVAPVLANL